MYGGEMMYISVTRTGVGFLDENKKGRAVMTLPVMVENEN